MKPTNARTLDLADVIGLTLFGVQNRENVESRNFSDMTMDSRTTCACACHIKNEGYERESTWKSDDMSNHRDSLDARLQKIWNPHLLPLDELMCQLLKSMAWRFSVFYSFVYDDCEGPTIMDLLRVHKHELKPRWAFLRYTETGSKLDPCYGYGFLVDFEAGEPKTKIALPDVYSKNEWELIERVANHLYGSNLDPNHDPVLIDYKLIAEIGALTVAKKWLI